jgi:two-component system, NarL family, sensor kinase
MNRRITILLLFSFLCTIAIAQKKVNDSLTMALSKATQDTVKAAILNELCNIQNKPEMARKYANQLLEVATKAKYNKGMIWGYNQLGFICKKEGDFKDALTYYDKAMLLTDPKKDEFAIAKINNNIGESYRLMGEPSKALSYYFSSLATLEKLGKQKLAAMSLNNIAIVYRNQKQLEKALEYNYKSLAIKEKIQDKEGMAISYDNIGIIHAQQKKFKEAIENCQKSIAIREGLEDTIGLAKNYNNLSGMYIDSGNPALGLSYQLKSLAMREYIHDKRGIAMSQNNIGNAYNLMGDYKKALSYQLKALELSQQLDSKDLLLNTYESLGVVNKNLNDYKQAFYYQGLANAVKDSMLNVENTKQIAEMQTKYDTDKKEKENQLLTSDNALKATTIQQQNTERNLLILSIVGIVLLSLLLYNRYKLKQKALFQKELIHEQTLRSKAIIEAEEKERIRIAQELHDGIGQQLSAAKLNMSSLQANLTLETEHQKLMLQNALDIIDESVKEVRTVSHSMMPNALLKSGLASAVREFLNRISHTDNLKIELDINGLNERLESTMESVLFRVLQEIVNNIIKHSKATIVNIQIIRHEGELTLMVEDNGVGFDVAKQTNNGIGLKNIQSRIQYLNGQVYFDSHVGKGTTVSIEIPIK